MWWGRSRTANKTLHWLRIFTINILSSFLNEILIQYILLKPVKSDNIHAFDGKDRLSHLSIYGKTDTKDSYICKDIMSKANILHLLSHLLP